MNVFGITNLFIQRFGDHSLQWRWVIAIKKTNQLPTTLPIILYLVIGITN